ncbi:MAG: hypothetical protein H0V05_00880 [Euzebyaceae bacterium]|nr:hypothetical protein [Euzebyaceae bacterium]
MSIPAAGGVDSRWNTQIMPRVTGNFTGTTDEIIQWAACKWGFDEDIVRAVAVGESSWRMSQLGDYRDDPAKCAPGYGTPCPTSFGMMQVKWTPPRHLPAVQAEHRVQHRLHLGRATRLLRGL